MLVMMKRNYEANICQQKTIVEEKLKSGVPVDRILEDARKLNTPKIERYNLLSSMDVTYLLRKHNVEKKRDKDG
jgi:hypothetical protein